MKAILKYTILFLAFAVTFVLPAILIPLQKTVEKQSEHNPLLFLIFLLVNFFVVVYLINRLGLRGMKLVFTIIILFWGLQTFMTQIETWYFIDAMPTITAEELRNFFVRPLITGLLFIPLATWALGKWKQDSATTFSSAHPNVKWPQLLWLSIAYVAIYFVFGYFIAWQFEEVRVFYSGQSADLGFIRQMVNNVNINSSIFPFQLLRGLLWILMGLPVLIYLNGARKEKIIMCVVLYALLPTIQLIVDNPYMPPTVRLAHFFEVFLSNGLFGFLIGYALTKPIAH